MKDATSTIRSAFSTLLTGNVTYNNRKVQVFDHTPSPSEAGIAQGALFTYIELGQMTDVETSDDSDTFTHDCTIDVDIVVGFPGMGSNSILDGIVNQVMVLIVPAKGDVIDLGANFTNIMPRLENTLYREQPGSHKMVIKTLRYRLTIDET